MPDFERITRDLELHLTNNSEIVKARHRGEDQARKQIAWLFVIVALLGSLIYILRN